MCLIYTEIHELIIPQQLYFLNTMNVKQMYLLALYLRTYELLNFFCSHCFDLKDESILK